MRTILFVCVHNAGRSQMAAALLNAKAKQRGLALCGESAGTAPTDVINPLASMALAEIGIDLSHATPRLLNQIMADAADRIISMGCGVDAAACPARFLITEDWDLPDPAGQPLEVVRAIRDAISIKVDRLLDAFMD